MKLTTMGEAIAEYVHDGDMVAIEGFTAFICFSAAHEIIRQGRRELTLCRMTPDLIYDQMVAAGCSRKLIFSYLGNPGVGSLHSIRRAIEKGIPHSIEIEEYSHFGMVSRYMAGAARLPFFPLKRARRLRLATRLRVFRPRARKPAILRAACRASRNSSKRVVRKTMRSSPMLVKPSAPTRRRPYV